MWNDDYALVPSRSETRLLNALPGVVLPQGTSGGDVLELVLVIEDTNLSARGLGNYLVLADRVYGRFSPEGLKSYVRRAEGRLQISQVRQGSIEVLFEQLITNLPDARSIIVLWLFLHYLPSISGSLKDMAAAYQSVQDGRLANEKRKQLRSELQQNDALAKLDDSQRRELAKLLLATGDRERRILQSASGFARKNVRSVRITVKRVEEANAIDE